MKFGIKTLKAALVVTAAAVVVACGGAGTAFPTATSNATTAINTTTGAAVIGTVTNTPFVFAAGVPDFGTTTSTTVTFPTTSTFTMTNGTNTANGNLTFGSCKFTATTSSIPGVPVGTTITIAGCNIVANTTGLALSGSGQTVQEKLVFNAVSSGLVSGTVTIAANGNISYGGVVVGTVTANTGTGGN
jgi:hypothetical protein